jgi:rhodanese-related sulfurtransferase
MVIRSITTEQARTLFNEGILFVDARELIEYEDGHIPGALPSEDFMDLTMTIEAFQGKSKPIVAYCDGGECAKSEDLAYDLQENGFSTIYIFLDGWSEWNEQGFEIEK